MKAVISAVPYDQVKVHSCKNLSAKFIETRQTSGATMP